MNALEFLQSRGKPAPSHPVVVRLSGKDPQGSDRVAEAEAVFVFVDDDSRLRAADEAADAISKIKTVSEERRRAMGAYSLLVRALRQKDASSRAFFDTTLQAQSMLVSDEAVRLTAEYQRFVDTHYPDVPSTEEMKAIQEDAKTLFFADLISKHGYWRILRALPSLAVMSGASLALNFSVTPPSSK